MVFWLKFALANLALASSLYLVFSRPSFLERPSRGFIIAYFGARLTILAVLLLALKFSYPAENMGMYYYYAHRVLDGAVPNRDFYMVYGILFPHLLAAAVALWDNRFVLIILFQFIEFGAIYAIFTQKKMPLSLRAFLTYALNPVVLVWIWLGLQNQAMCLIPVAAVFAVRSETGRSLLYAIGFAVSKVFALWTIIPALLGQGWKSRFVFAGALLVIYGPFLLMGATPLSVKATEASGSVTEAANHPGIESLLGLIPLNEYETKVTHWVLVGTAGLLLITMITAFLLRFRLDREKLGEETRFQREIVFTAIFATVLTLIYQAFATYTIPDYLLVVVAFVPVLVQAKFWTKLDQVLFVALCYFQASSFLIWFHLADFGVSNQRTSLFFVSYLLLGSGALFVLFGRSVYRLVKIIVGKPGRDGGLYKYDVG